jgi:hypothetical protein
MTIEPKMSDEPNFYTQVAGVQIDGSPGWPYYPSYRDHYLYRHERPARLFNKRYFLAMNPNVSKAYISDEEAAKWVEHYKKTAFQWKENQKQPQNRDGSYPPREFYQHESVPHQSQTSRSRTSRSRTESS